MTHSMLLSRFIELYNQADRQKETASIAAVGRDDVRDKAAESQLKKTYRLLC